MLDPRVTEEGGELCRDELWSIIYSNDLRQTRTGDDSVKDVDYDLEVTEPTGKTSGHLEWTS